jgi:hypothetical protein
VQLHSNNSISICLGWCITCLSAYVFRSHFISLQGGRRIQPEDSNFALKMLANYLHNGLNAAYETSCHASKTPCNTPHPTILFKRVSSIVLLQ